MLPDKFDIAMTGVSAHFPGSRRRRFRESLIELYRARKFRTR
jgi:hypothetical protein